MVFVTIPPILLRSKSDAYSAPCPKVPDAMRTGFLSVSLLAIFVERSNCLIALDI